jgi:hypothetical protein
MIPAGVQWAIHECSCLGSRAIRSGGSSYLCSRSYLLTFGGFDNLMEVERHGRRGTEHRRSDVVTFDNTSLELPLQIT